MYASKQTEMKRVIEGFVLHIQKTFFKSISNVTVIFFAISIGKN